MVRSKLVEALRLLDAGDVAGARVVICAALRDARTRVQLETVVAAFDAGAIAEEIVQQYPALDLSCAYAVISYVLANCSAVDSYVAEREQAAAEVRAGIEKRQPPDAIRARMLARRTQASSG